MNRLDYTKEAIRERVSIRQVVERYTDRRFDRNGFCSCPLHREKTASFKIDEKKQLYYCFGCGEGGDIFRFVSKYLGIDFKESVTQIDKDFCLGITGERISVAAQNAVREARKKRALELQEKEEKNALYDNLCAQYRLINELINNLQPMTEIWGKMITKRAWLEERLDEAMEGICK